MLKRFAATLIFSLLLIQINSDISFSDLTSNASPATNAITGSWVSTISSASGPSTTGPYTVTWTGNLKKQYALISLINSGSFDLVSGHFTFTSAKANGDTTSPPTLIFDLCSTTWDAIAFTCSGTITTFGTATSGQINMPQLIPIGGRVVIRVTDTRDAVSNYTTTFNSISSRSDIRTGGLFNL